VSQLLDQVEADPSRRFRDSDLRLQGLDPAAVRRYFLRAFGMTFQAYSRACGWYCLPRHPPGRKY